MTIYYSLHFDLNYPKGKLTQERRIPYKQLTELLSYNKELLSIFSLNAECINSLLWADDDLLKFLSKRSYENKTEILSSAHSPYIPFYNNFEENILEKQLHGHYTKLKELYQAQPLTGFYPPFGCWDNKFLTSFLVQKQFRYSLIDWNVVRKGKENQGDITSKLELFLPFKINNSNIIGIPTISIDSFLEIFRNRYAQVLKRSDFPVFIKHIFNNLTNYSPKENYYICFSFTYNNLHFPQINPDFDLNLFLNDLQRIDIPDLKMVLPSQILDKYSSEPSLDLTNSYSGDVEFTHGNHSELQQIYCCQHYQQMFSDYINKIKNLEEIISSLDESEIKTNSRRLLTNAWNNLLNYHHNLGFSRCGGLSIKNLDTKKLIRTWSSIHFLHNLLDITERYIKGNAPTNEVSKNVLENTYSLKYTNKAFLATFLFSGGIISNLFNYSSGDILASSPLNYHSLPEHGEDNPFGLMYDIFSKDHSGNYNLFNEWYSCQIHQNSQEDKFVFSTFIYKGIKLEKEYIFPLHGKYIDIVYKFINTAEEKESFNLYSTSKFNINEDMIPGLNKTDLQSYVTKNTLSQLVTLENKLTNTEMSVEVPLEVTVDTFNDFKMLYLTFQMRLISLTKGEEKIFNYRILNNKKERKRE